MRTLNKNTLCRMEQYIHEFQTENGRSPSYRNIMHAMGMSSLNLVQRYVLALENDGRIKRTRLGNIELPAKLDTGEMAIAPLVGQIACGESIFIWALIPVSERNLMSGLYFCSGDLFMLRAFGDSMIDAGINKGDLLVIRKQQEANDGDIVVALTSGNNTLKRLYHRNGKIVLHPENKTMKDIVVSNCEIQGVLVGCIKTY